MNRKRLWVGFAALCASLAISVISMAQQSPLESQKAKEIRALVDKAAALVERQGKSAFPEFRKSGSEWLYGDTYLFVGDMNGIALFNGGFPEREGEDQSALKDANGKLIVAEFMKVIKSKGSGWVDYVFPKPGQTQPSKKWGYVKAVTVDGKPGYIGAGFYPE